MFLSYHEITENQFIHFSLLQIVVKVEKNAV
jgi:hypothetical protein